jgi:hypothetical protein
MNDHLHTHNMVPGGGLSLDGRRWVGMPPGEFLPLDLLRRIYRELFLNELRKLYRADRLAFPGPWRRIEGLEAFENWLGELSEIDWVIRLRSVWDRSGPEVLEAANKTVAYLARYANRVAISNSRLVAIEDDQVLFSYKDYRDGGQWKTAEVHGVEFIGRFLQHVLPQRLRHIRRYGFMGPRVASKKLPVIRALLGVEPPQDASEAPPAGEAPEEPPSEQAERAEQDEPTRVCRKCKCGRLVLRAQKARPTVAQLMRMPPDMEPESVSGELQLLLPLTGFL